MGRRSEKLASFYGVLAAPFAFRLSKILEVIREGQSDQPHANRMGGRSCYGVLRPRHSPLNLYTGYLAQV